MAPNAPSTPGNDNVEKLEPELDTALHSPMVLETPSKPASGEFEKRDPGLELTTQLPEEANTNSDGVPTYLGLTGTKLITAITVTATMGFLLFGYDQGVMSGLITGDQFIETFPACDKAVQGASRASLLQATYTSIYEVGCLAGAIFALMRGNKFGRRKMMQLGAYIMIVGVVIQVTAIKGHNAGAQFLIGRTITGVGNGMNTATIPSWVAETSRAHNRGLLVCIEASTVAFGTAIAYWVDFGISFVKTSVNWRFPIALQVVFAIALLAGIWSLPESPRWLMHEGRHIEAQRVVAALAGDTYDSEVTLAQIRLIMQAIEHSHQLGVVKKRNVFTNGPSQHFRRMLIGASSQLFQQIGGCNAVIYFAPVIFEQNLGLDRQLSLILGGVNVSCYALSAVASYGLIERVGRRKMYLAGTVGQTVSMIIIFACYLKGGSALNGAVFGLFLFLFFFGATWLELPWLTPAEVNPLRTRTNANAISTCTNWAFNAAVVQWTPPMLTSLGWGTFLFFAVVNACFIPFIYFFYIETAGRSLEEIDLVFAKGYAENRSYVAVSLDMPKYTPEEVTVEAKRLHDEHIAKRGCGETEEEGNVSRDGTIVDQETASPKKG